MKIYICSRYVNEVVMIIPDKLSMNYASYSMTCMTQHGTHVQHVFNNSKMQSEFALQNSNFSDARFFVTKIYTNVPAIKTY